MDDAQESFVRREEARPSRQCISLEHTLTSMFGKDFDDAAPLGTTGDIPLKVSPRDVEHSIEFIRNQLIGGENPEGGWIASKRILELNKEWNI